MACLQRHQGDTLFSGLADGHLGRGQHLGVPRDDDPSHRVAIRLIHLLKQIQNDPKIIKTASFSML